MKACILNSGIGKRMGELTKSHPKCMVEIGDHETILSRQLSILSACAIRDVVITTGPFREVLCDYADRINEERKLGLSITYIWNDQYADTNYIYSLLLAKDALQDDLILMHGDLVFEKGVLQELIMANCSVMTTSSTLALPEKDFKAVVEEGCIHKIGIEFFDHAYAAQPLYKILKQDWIIWLRKIEEYCEEGIRSCYAENAFNEVSDHCRIVPYDVRDRLCNEIDNAEDLKVIRERLLLLK